ncbi:MAG TPA: hypothetical protein VIA62_12095 [Thermoanaerobaculia bacterium]|nr:hypothetical protein [Thermoanaerobaculia bacterium]
MKKMLLGLSLAVAALGLLMSPAMAETSPPQAAPALSAEDQAFLASLAAPVATPAPELAAKRPTIHPKDTCIANCASGTVSCSGAGTCTAVDRNCSANERGHVTCGSTTTFCPTTCPPPVCPPDWCTDDCSLCDCGGTLVCNATFCTSHCKCKICPQ